MSDLHKSAEQLANKILSAAGTSLRNYMPVTQDAILAAAAELVAGEELESFQAVCNRVARDLPAGWELNINLAASSGTVQLVDPDGEDVEFPLTCEGLLSEVNDALEEAIRIEREGIPSE